jgi:hypothetical protein
MVGLFADDRQWRWLGEGRAGWQSAAADVEVLQEAAPAGDVTTA